MIINKLIGIICLFFCLSSAFLIADTPKGWSWFEIPIQTHETIKFLSPTSIPSIIKSRHEITISTHDKFSNAYSIGVSSEKLEPTLVNILREFFPNWQKESKANGYQIVDCRIYQKDGSFYFDAILESMEGSIKERHIFTQNHCYTIKTTSESNQEENHQEFVDSFQIQN